jgi:hypothetical protein
MEEVKGGWGEFCNDKVHILCCLPIYREWDGLDSSTPFCKTYTYKFQSRNWNRGCLGVDRRITIEIYSKKLSLKMWAEFVWFRTWCIGLGLHIECGNELWIP